MIDHPQRIALHNEIHARPPEPMTPPLAITHVVMLADAGAREASREHVSSLLRDHHLPVLDAQTTHSRHNLGGYRLRWERHTEFVSWSFMRPLADDIASVDAATVEIHLPPRRLELYGGRQERHEPDRIFKGLLQSVTLNRTAPGANSAHTALQHVSFLKTKPEWKFFSPSGLFWPSS